MVYRVIPIMSLCLALATSCRTPISALDNPKPTLMIRPVSQPAKNPNPASVTAQLQKSVVQVQKAVVGI